MYVRDEGNQVEQILQNLVQHPPNKRVFRKGQLAAFQIKDHIDVLSGKNVSANVVAILTPSLASAAEIQDARIGMSLPDGLAELLRIALLQGVIAWHG